MKGFGIRWGGIGMDFEESALRGGVWGWFQCQRQCDAIGVYFTLKLTFCVVGLMEGGKMVFGNLGPSGDVRITQKENVDMFVDLLWTTDRKLIGKRPLPGS
jgi:hypothetical protein